jgi:hypothetical protein
MISFPHAALRVGLALGLIGLTTGCASRLLLHPDLAQYLDGRDLKRVGELNSYKPELVSVTNSAGYTLHGVLFVSGDTQRIVMASGGNATSRTRALRYYEFLLRHQLSLLVFTFQGFDDNQGKADLNSMLGDAEAFYEYLETRFAGAKIAYVANSISTAAALCLPTRQTDVSAVVVEAAVDPKTVLYAKLTQWWYLFPLYPLLFPVASIVTSDIPRDLDVRRCISSYSSVPILFIHHPDDDVVPFGHAYELYSAYQGRKEFAIPQFSIPRAYHASLSSDLGLQCEIVRFLDSAFSNFKRGWPSRSVERAPFSSARSRVC